jgi:hypothetical protein
MSKFEVTDAMLDAAEQAYDTIAAIEHDAWCYTAPTRAAITAAIEASGLVELIAKADAVLDHADVHCRAFPIATAPTTGEWFLVWDAGMGEWFVHQPKPFDTPPNERYTHWRPLPPPPSNPPLPAVFVELGQALERLKEGR